MLRRREFLVFLAGAAVVGGAAPLAVPGAAGARADRPGAVRAAGGWGRATEVPGLGALNADGAAEVFSVSCPSTGNCAADGTYTDRRNLGQVFVVSQRHGHWGKAIEVPGLGALNTSRDSTSPADASDVSCASAGNCAVGGDYTVRDGGQNGFVAVERNGHWGKAIEMPRPGALYSGGFAHVDSVSCASAGNCTAGGDYSDRHSNQQGFVVSERNGRWGTPIEVPGLGALNKGFANVGSVSCASVGNCAAGGAYSDGEQGFVAVERDGRWGKAIEVPGLGALNKGGEATVSEVSCASAGNCAAGGSYASSADLDAQGFVVAERHGHWGTAIEVPGLGALNKGGDAMVNEVSCPSAGNCVAGGGYSDGHFKDQGFVVAERNGHWGKAIEVLEPGALKTGVGDGTTVFTVSCASVGNCAAGGDYSDRRSNLQGFVVSERNGHWGKAIEVPGLGALNVDGRDGALVFSVSCAPAGTCAAGGYYTGRHRRAQGFVVSQTG